MGKGFHVLFSGVVQGVGFRFVAKRLADRHRLKGWVKNVFSGQVELLVKGNRQSLDNFIKELKDEFREKVTNVEIEEIDSSGEYSSFQIR